jgi:hypothetical protein
VVATAQPCRCALVDVSSAEEALVGFDLATAWQVLDLAGHDTTIDGWAADDTDPDALPDNRGRAARRARGRDVVGVAVAAHPATAMDGRVPVAVLS